MSSRDSIYHTSEGQKLIRSILAASKPVSIESHIYQEEAICRVPDGEDVVATMATGAGKTAFLSFIMIMICSEISRNPSLARQGRGFSLSPCMLAVCLTKALEVDMSTRMQAFGLQTLVFNSNTITEARSDGKNPWAVAEQGTI